jgi:hypothetical protein
MPLAPGTWLNHYQILGHLGAGGSQSRPALRDKGATEVAVQVEGAAANGDIWIYDIPRGRRQRN